MKKIAYLSMDVHARNCVLGEMDANGKFLGNRCFVTCENNIINALKTVKAKRKYLVIEAGPLANWVAQSASPYLTRVFISDPRENALIYKSSQKYDKVDTKKLCRLLRLNEFKEVYRPESDQRAIFKAAVQHYLDLRDQLKAVKNKIKAKYRQWGVIDCFTDSVYSVNGRKKFLKQVNQHPIYLQLKRLYELMDHIEAIKQAAQVRWRPILMTTTTTVLGLMPMALDMKEGAEIRIPLAVTLIGGLIFGTFLTLVYIPVLYSIVIAENPLKENKKQT